MAGEIAPGTSVPRASLIYSSCLSRSVRATKLLLPRSLAEARIRNSKAGPTAGVCMGAAIGSSLLAHKRLSGRKLLTDFDKEFIDVDGVLCTGLDKDGMDGICVVLGVSLQDFSVRQTRATKGL